MIKGKSLFCLKIVTTLAVLALCLGPALTSFPTYADDGGADAPIVDAPLADAPVMDAPAADAPVMDAPAADAPAADAPAADAPVMDAPAADAPAADAPIVDAPVADVPAVDAPVADAPAVDAPVADVPAVDAPVVDAPVADAPVADAPTVDAPVADAPVADAPAADALSPDAGAAVTTDQADYGPSDPVSIAGQGFTPNAEVTVSVTQPDGSITEWMVTADDTGSIDTTYQLENGVQDVYTLNASDGTNTAQATFTDGWWSIGTIAVASGQPNWISNEAGHTTTVLNIPVTNQAANNRFGRAQITGLTFADDGTPIPGLTATTGLGNFHFISNGATESFAVAIDASGTSDSDSGMVDVTANAFGQHLYWWWVIPYWSDDTNFSGTTADVFELANVGVDNGAPVLTATPDRSPDSNDWYNDNVYYVWNAQDSLSGIADLGGDVNWDTFTEGAPSVDGSYNVTTEGNASSHTGTAEDVAGNTATETITIKLDKTAPEVTATLPDPTGSHGWYKNAVILVWNAHDNLSGFDADGTLDMTPWNTTINTQGKNLTDTQSATDWAGNTDTETSAPPVNIDWTPPTVTGTPSTGPTGSHGWYNAPIVLVWNAHDNLSGFDADGTLDMTPWNTTINTQGKNLTDTQSATDWAGNTGTGTSAPGANIDWTAPTVIGTPNTAPNSYNWYNNNVRINWLANDNLSGFNSSGSQLTKSWNTWITTQGTNLTSTGSATDWAGNTGTGTSAPGVNIDKTDPTLSGTPETPPNADGWYNAPVPVLWTAQDTLSGLRPDGSKDPVTWNTTINGEGRWQSSTQSATDLAGNRARETVTAKIDQTAPLLIKDIDGTEGDNGWYISPVDVTLTATDPGLPIVQHSGINYIQYQVDGNAPNQVYSPRLDEIFFLLPHDEGLPVFSTDFSINDDGNHTLQHEAFDVAGNDSDDYAGDSQQVRVDQTAPTLEKTINGEAPKPQGSWYNKQDAPNGVLMVALNAHDDTSGVGSITYTKDGSSTAETNNAQGADEHSRSNDFSATFEITKQGATNLNHQAADYAGNTYTLEDQQVRLDSVDPTLVKVASRTGTNEVTVTLSGADATSGVDYIRYSVDGGASWAYANVVDNYGPNSMATTFILNGVGDHNLSHLVLDAAGNQYVLPDQTITLETPTFGAPPLPSTPMITIDMMGTVAEYPVTLDGKLMGDVRIASPDGRVSLVIPAGTLVLNADLTPTYQNADYDIVVKAAGTPTAPAGYQMISAYEAFPSGLTFSKDASFIVTYDQDKLPAGSSAIIAYYDETADKWEPLETAGYVAANGIEIPDTIFSHVGHFTYFAVLAKLPAGE